VGREVVGFEDMVGGLGGGCCGMGEFECPR
jgi:hypothetical protein